MISILVPSMRPEGLRTLLESVRDTISHPDNAEVIVGHDLDGDTIQGIAREFGQRPIGLPPRQVFSCVAAMNYLAWCSMREYLWILNDDCVIVSRDWDLKIMAQPSGTLGVPSDEEQVGSWDFPVFTRKHLMEFGELFPHKFNSWGADSWVFQAYKRAGKLHIQDVQVEHRMRMDISDRKRMERINKMADWKKLARELDMAAYIEKLQGMK